MADSAHHLDLRLPNEKDPLGVIQGFISINIFILNFFLN